jgi:bifunctional DNase/RNase
MALEMAVRLVSIDPQGGPCAVYLHGVGDTGSAMFLPIVIGRNEAVALAMSQQKVPRPLSHDLIVTTIAQLGGAVSKITIDSVREGVFYATVHVARDGQSRTVDCRPSDAINVAVRAGVSIWVDDSVLREAGVESAPDDEGGQKRAKPPEPQITEEQLGPFRDVIGSLDLKKLGDSD